MSAPPFFFHRRAYYQNTNHFSPAVNPHPALSPPPRTPLFPWPLRFLILSSEKPSGTFHGHRDVSGHCNISSIFWDSKSPCTGTRKGLSVSRLCRYRPQIEEHTLQKRGDTCIKGFPFCSRRFSAVYLGKASKFCLPFFCCSVDTEQQMYSSSDMCRPHPLPEIKFRSSQLHLKSLLTFLIWANKGFSQSVAVRRVGRSGFPAPADHHNSRSSLPQLPHHSR